MKVAIPDLISNSYFPVAAAVELGFFEREGLDMELELIFPVDRTLEVLRLEHGRWLILGTHAGSEVVRAEPFGAVALALQSLWGDPPEG